MRRTDSVGVGVIGANSSVATKAVLPAIDAAPGAHVAATASRSEAVPGPWSDTAVADYMDVIEHPGVEAVYIPLPNGMHREWTERAASAGKHVLCEKPLAPDATTAAAMAAACAQAGVLLAEAYMTPFHRRYRHLVDMVHDGAIGGVEHVDARFTFTIGPEASANYRWDPDQGGGALLDVGIYCLGAVVELFGAEPTRIEAGTEWSPTGVDAATHAVLTYAEEHSVRHASIHCSFVDDERQTLVISGTRGRIELTSDTFTGRDGEPYEGMIEAFAAAVRGTREWPRPAQRSVEMLELIESIRESAR